MRYHCATSPNPGHPGSPHGPYRDSSGTIGGLLPPSIGREVGLFVGRGREHWTAWKRRAREMAAPPVALAVIGVDDRPLYLEIAQEGGDENLGLHFVLHCALDFVDEKREWSSAR